MQCRFTHTLLVSDIKDRSQNVLLDYFNNILDTSLDHDEYNKEVLNFVNELIDQDVLIDLGYDIDNPDYLVLHIDTSKCLVKDSSVHIFFHFKLVDGRIYISVICVTIHLRDIVHNIHSYVEMLDSSDYDNLTKYPSISNKYRDEILKRTEDKD